MYNSYCEFENPIIIALLVPRYTPCYYFHLTSIPLANALCWSLKGIYFTIATTNTMLSVMYTIAYIKLLTIDRYKIFHISSNLNLKSRSSCFFNLM